MKLNLQNLTLALFALLICSVSFGQNACSGKLADAKFLFESGQIEEIPSILDSCMHKGFSRDQKIQAYRLLIQVYLFDYNPIKANQIMDQMLHDIKDYKLQPTDPVEFIELFNTYRLYPTWGIGLKSEINLSSINVIKNYSIASTNAADKSYEPIEPGWNAGISLNRFFANKLWVTASLVYQTMNYSSHEWINQKQGEALTFREKNSMFSFPIIFNYAILNKTVSPFIYGGAQLAYLYHAKASLFPSSITDYHFTGNVTNSRNNYNIFASGGLGLSVKSTSGLYLISVGYDYNLSSYTKSDKRYSNLNDILTNQHLDDNFRINKFNLSLSYSHLFYRIKKKQLK